ncbi:MAG TPA: type IV secretion system protein [Steroidobacteraceae bacterium]|nr:type IV secretion system protein [Steroidobacteraceae bacterium]
MQLRVLPLLWIALLAVSPAARAQFAVIDAASLGQLVSEVQVLEQQLATARGELSQAQAQFQAMTGSRGMQRLLAGTPRNYLPADWSALEGALDGHSGAGGAAGRLTADLAMAVGANSVLTAGQLAALTPAAGVTVIAGRRSAALLQVLSHEALANSSARFADLQQLIDAIGAAGDQKAILELQARIGAEGGMLANERTKLENLFEGAHAEEQARAQRTRELIVAGHGDFASRFEPQP